MSDIHHNPFRTPQLTPQNTNNTTTSRTLGTYQPDAGPLNGQDTIPDEAPPPYSLTADASQGEIPIEVGPSRPFQNTVDEGHLSSPIVQSSTRTNDTPSEIRLPPLPPRRSPVMPASTGLTSPQTFPSSPRVEIPPTPYVPQAVSPTLSPIQDRRRVYDPPTGIPPRSPISESASSRPISTRPIEDGRPTTTPVPGHPLLLKNRLLVYPSGYECSQCKNTGYKNNDPSHPCNKCWNKYSKPYIGALAYAPFPSEPSTRSGGSNFQRPLPKLRPPQTGICNAPPSASVSSVPATAQGSQEPARLLRRRSESKPNPTRNDYLHTVSTVPPTPQGSQEPARLLRRRSESKLNPPRNEYPRSVSSPGPVSPRIITSFAPPQARSCAFSGPLPITPRQALSLNPLFAGHRSSFVSTPPDRFPPRGSVVFQAGDPRIGGRLCWRCDGRGTVSYFLLDTSTCDVCNGIGRTFP